MPEVKVTRNLLAQYYGITTDSVTAYHAMFNGFVKLTEENSPQVDSVAYVNNRNDSPTVIGYQTKWAYEAQYIAGNPVCDDLAAIARQQKVGSDCERYLVDVDLNVPVVGFATTYAARKVAVAVEATGPNGDPKSITKLSGNLHQIGDVVIGVFNTTTKAFTEGTAVATYAVTMTVVPADATVLIVDSDGASVPVTVNAITGVVTIPNLPDDIYEYTVFKDGFVTDVGTFEVDGATEAVGTITITEPA